MTYHHNSGFKTQSEIFAYDDDFGFSFNRRTTTQKIMPSRIDNILLAGRIQDTN
jgi:hypothetical protein